MIRNNIVFLWEWFHKRPLAKEIVNNSALFSFSQAFQLGLSGLLSILLARKLGVEVMGMYIATQAMVGLVYVFTRLGVDIPAKREASRDKNLLSSYFGSALAVYLTITTPVTLL